MKRKPRRSYFEIWLYRVGRVIGYWRPFYSLMFGIQTGMDQRTTENHQQTSERKAAEKRKAEQNATRRST